MMHPYSLNPAAISNAYRSSQPGDQDVFSLHFKMYLCPQEP